MPYRRNERVFEMQNFTSGYMKGRSYGRVGGRLRHNQNFLDAQTTNRQPYSAKRAQELRYYELPRLTTDRHNGTKLAVWLAPKCSCRHFSRSNLTPPNSGSDFLAPVFLCIAHLFAWTFIRLTIS